MVIKLDSKTIFRKGDYRYLVVSIFFGIFLLFSGVNDLKVIYILFLAAILIYRFVIIKQLKKRTLLFIEDGNIILESKLVNKRINFENIKSLGYVERSGSTGDLIINLSIIRVGLAYYGNLIFDINDFNSNYKTKSICIPDLQNVKEIYLDILKLMELDKNGVQKIECIRSNVEFKEGICIISNRKSEIYFRYANIIYKNKNTVEVKAKNFSLNSIYMQKFGLPPMKTRVSSNQTKQS